MGVATLSLTPPSSTFLSNRALVQNSSNQRVNKSFQFSVSAKLGKEEPKSEKKPLFYSVTEALDFSQVRSAEDAQLLEDARQATRSGERMTREQYGALRRKIGGTYKNFFKSYVEACKICRKDTRGETRQVDEFGRYVHVACLENSKSGNFFTRLLSR